MLSGTTCCQSTITMYYTYRVPLEHVARTWRTYDGNIRCSSARIDLIGFYGKVKFNEIHKRGDRRFQTSTAGKRERTSHFVEESLECEQILQTIELIFDLFTIRHSPIRKIPRLRASNEISLTSLLNSYSVHAEFDRASSRPVHPRGRKGAISRARRWKLARAICSLAEHFYVPSP